MGKMIDMTGKQFGRLTVIKKVANRGKYVCWLCNCDCGNKIVVQGDSLRSLNTQSCGCLQKQRASDGKRTHGESRTRLHSIWKNIKARTVNINNKRFKDYGGREIRMCEEWLNSYENFRDWSIVNGYSDDLTIDRINNDLGYSPENCQWVTIKEQANNKRNNLMITYRERTQTLAQWCDELELKYKLIWERINKYGWTVQKAFETPLKINK